MAETIEGVQKIRSAAATFYRVDFHMHSPASHDWDNSDSTDYVSIPELDKVSSGRPISDAAIRTYRQHCVASKRDIAIITDHNRFAFAEKAAGIHDDGLLILPGIELSVKIEQPLLEEYRIHVLAVFPPGTDAGAIERLFPEGTPAENSRTGREEFTHPDFSSLLSKISGENGIAIAAHIYNNRGVQCTYMDSAELILRPISGTPEHEELIKNVGERVKKILSGFNCLQVRPSTEPSHFFDRSGELSIPLVLGTDCHKACELDIDDDSRMTYVKVGEVSLGALVEALKFPGTRIRFNRDQQRPPKILGIRLRSDEIHPDSFFKDLTLGYSDNLTCIVGPRGSGKSASIDAVRYVMGYNRSLDEIERVEEQIKERQKHTLHATTIELLYQRRDGVVHSLRAVYHPDEVYATTVYDLDGNLLKINDVESCQDYPVNLYGWNELELLAESTQSQRQMLDRFIAALPELKAERTRYSERLIENREQCISKARSLDKYFTNTEYDFLRIAEHKKEFENLNTPEMERIFKKLDFIVRQKAFLKKARERLQLLSAEIEIAPLAFLEFVKEESPEVLDWARTFIEQKLKGNEFDEFLRVSTETIAVKSGVAIKALESEEKEILAAENEALKEIKGVIGDSTSIKGDLRNEAKRIYERDSRNYEEYKKGVQSLESDLDRRAELLANIERTGKEIYATRDQEIEKIEEKVSIIEDDDFKINLALQQLGDKKEFLRALAEDDLTKPGYCGIRWKVRKIPEILASNLTPIQLGSAILRRDNKSLICRITDEGGTSFDITEEYSMQFIGENTPSEQLKDLEVSRYDAQKLEKVLRIQEIEVEDEFFIELGDKPIQNCSPGQRCSAMLPIVTLTSDAPLIIDQPEDNLDNRLVSKALFKILTQLKESRQVIFATHNPNILVSGDAEQVLVLGNNGALEEYGCVDKPEIVKTVISLMEGGKEAFEKREVKYEPYIHH